MMPLLLADTGSEQTVQLVKGNDKTKTFIEKLGIVPGAKLTIVAVTGSGFIVSVKDARIALTREIAARVMV